jgi:phospholipase/carboxylesterase
MAHLPHSGDSDDPHRGQPIETAGAPPQAAEAAVIMLHGRGSTARQILRLIDEFYHHGVLYLAPQAARNRWYPRSGYGPIAANEPWFSSALSQVSTAVEMATDLGIGPERIIFFGFSQGACLASEFVARNPRQYGGLIALSGSLLGPETGTEYTGSLEGSPVFFGCSTDDLYVAAERIDESRTVFEGLDGAVTARLYDDLGHAINDDEIRMTNTFIERLGSTE